MRRLYGTSVLIVNDKLIGVFCRQPEIKPDA